MIYRAICYCTHERMIDIPESVVFIQAATQEAVAVRLTNLLADIWNVPAETVEFYNLNDTPELFANAIGGSRSGDARFFEIGSRGEAPIYLDHDAPLLLLPPKANRRLLNAWKKLYMMPDFVSDEQF